MDDSNTPPASRAISKELAADTSNQIQNNSFGWYLTHFHRRSLTLLIVAAVLSALAIIGSLVITGNGDTVALTVIVAGCADFMFFLAFVLVTSIDFTATRIAEFARANGYTWSEHGTDDNPQNSSLLSAPGKPMLGVSLSKTYNGAFLNDFSYTLTRGEGKYASVFLTNVLDITLSSGELPSMFLLSNASKGSSSLVAEASRRFGFHNTVSLEGDFNKYFTLYAPENLSIESLQVFSPNLMAVIEDRAKNLSIEFANQHIYLYTDGIATLDPLGYNKLFTAAKQLVDTIKIEAGVIAREDNTQVELDRAVEMAKHLNHRRVAIGRGWWISVISFCVPFALVAIEFLSNHPTQ